MAQVPYGGGVPEDTPNAAPPDDYQRVEATPASFGGLIAQGAEKAGAGAVDMSKFWGHVAANDASNNAQREASDLAEHIRTLQGQDALDAQQGAYKSLDGIYTKYRNQLATPDQQLLFDTQNRPFFDRYIRGQMNTTFIDAGRQFATKTADAGIEVAHSMAATSGSDGNWPTVEVARNKALAGEIQKLQTAGLENDPDAREAARQKANLVYKSAIEGMLLKNPDGAQAKLDDPKIKSALGSAYDPLAKEVQAGVQKSYLSKADALEADDPTKAEAFVRGNEAKFGTLYGEALLKAQRATTQAAGKSLADTGLNASSNGWRSPTGTQQASYGPVFTRYNQYLNNGDVQSALRLSEGLRTEPYWDVNHWRIGYGSDTVTRADGSVETVTPFTRITPAEAERDLQRRTAMASDSAKASIGSAWDGMSAGAKSALTSVVYNYGRVPSDIASAAASGNANALARAIANHAGDNDGVNSRRRLAEAGAVLGKFGVSGPETTRSNQPGMTLESPQQEGDQTAPTAPVENAAFNPTAPVAPEPAPAPTDPVEVAYDTHARALQYVDEQNVPVPEKEAAKRELDQRLNYALAEAGEQQRAVKAREEAVSNDVLGSAHDGDFTGAYKKLDQYRKNHQIDEKLYDTMSDALAKQSGDPNPKWYGRGYNDALRRILLDAKDPDHIGNTRQLLELQVKGQITSRGMGDLQRSMTALTKSEDEVGLQTVRAKGLDALEQKLSAGIDPLGKIRSPQGMEMFRTVGVAQYNRAYNEWRNAVKEGKGDDFFALSDPKKLDAFAESIYPKRQRDQDMLGDQGGEAQPEQPGAPLPPSPPNVDESGWRTLMANAPPAKNGAVNHDWFASKLQTLISDPEKYGPLWDAAPIGSKLPSQRVFQALGIKYAPPPTQQGPEASGEASPPARETESEQSPAAAASTHRIKDAVGGFLRMLPTLGAPDLEHMTPAQMRARYGGGAPAPVPHVGYDNFSAANAALKMTPQEQELYLRHLTNLNGPGGVDNPDGSRSTLYQESVEVGGKTYNIPTVYDGKILPPKEALAKAKAYGIEKFPSYPDEATAEARYQQMHAYMDKDTGAFLTGRRSSADGESKK